MMFDSIATELLQSPTPFQVFIAAIAFTYGFVAGWFMKDTDTTTLDKSRIHALGNIQVPK